MDLEYQSKHWSDNIKELFERYYELEEQIKTLSPEELQKLPDSYRSFLSIEDYLKDLVLTGEEIIDIKLKSLYYPSYPNDEDIKDSELYQGLEKEGEKLKERYGKYKEIYQRLKKIYRKSKEKEPYSKLSTIEKIIEGKKGAIIDEIREAIREDN